MIDELMHGKLEGLRERRPSAAGLLKYPNECRDMIASGWVHVGLCSVWCGAKTILWLPCKIED